MFLILLGIINVIYFFNNNLISQEEFFNKAVYNSFKESYRGIVTNKYRDVDNHSRDLIIIQNNKTRKSLDFVYHRKELYNFIKINDTLIKDINTNHLKIKRKNLDTIISFGFENIKNSGVFSQKNNFIENK